MLLEKLCATVPVGPWLLGQQTPFESNTNPLSGVLSLLGTLAVLVLVMYLAYKCTKFIGKRYGVQSTGGNHIEILERVMVGQDRSLVIVRTGEKLLLLGVTAHHIEKLEELDPALFEGLPEAGAVPADSFSTLLKDSIGKGIHLQKGKKDREDD